MHGDVDSGRCSALQRVAWVAVGAVDSQRLRKSSNTSSTFNSTSKSVERLSAVMGWLVFVYWIKLWQMKC